MAYSRPEIPDGAADHEPLGPALASIGFVLGVPLPDRRADIEATLLRASFEGMLKADLRVLAILTTWLGVHHRYLHAARLRRMLRGVSDSRVQTYWSAIGSWLARDRRLAALGTLSVGEPIELLRTGTAFHVGRSGMDARFEGSALVVPAGILRHRVEDVLTPTELAARHAGYRNRVQMGPSWRADLWTALEADPSLTPSAAARLVGCSFAVAWEAVRDFEVWGQSSGHARLSGS